MALVSPAPPVVRFSLVTRLASSPIGWRSDGGIESLIRWDLELHDGGIGRTLQNDYKVPILLVGKLAEAIIVRLNEHEGEVLRANIKARMEGQRPQGCEVLSR